MNRMYTKVVQVCVECEDGHKKNKQIVSISSSKFHIPILKINHDINKKIKGGE